MYQLSTLIPNNNFYPILCGSVALNHGISQINDGTGFTNKRKMFLFIIIVFTHFVCVCMTTSQRVFQGDSVNALAKNPAVMFM